jgi:flagellar motor protein MotB
VHTSAWNARASTSRTEFCSRITRKAAGTSEPALNRVLATLKGQPKLMVELQGHTDNVGNDEYNLKLSGARAQAVMQWAGRARH